MSGAGKTGARPAKRVSNAAPRGTARQPSRATREAGCQGNIERFERGLARFTFGNASAVDRERGLIVIKPSGVPYESLTPRSMVVTDFQGAVVGGTLRPSSDLATHARSIARSLRLARLCIRIRCSPPSSRRRTARSPAWERRTPTTSTGPSR